MGVLPFSLEGRSRFPLPKSSNIHRISVLSSLCNMTPAWVQRILLLPHRERLLLSVSGTCPTATVGVGSVDQALQEEVFPTPPFRWPLLACDAGTPTISSFACNASSSPPTVPLLDATLPTWNVQDKDLSGQSSCSSRRQGVPSFVQMPPGF